MKITRRSRRKLLVLTGHCGSELYDKYNKNLDLIFDIFKEGCHSRISKEKWMVILQTKKNVWELVYTETENEVILIHLKLRRQ